MMIAFDVTQVLLYIVALMAYRVAFSLIPRRAGTGFKFCVSWLRTLPFYTKREANIGFCR